MICCAAIAQDSGRQSDLYRLICHHKYFDDADTWR